MSLLLFWHRSKVSFLISLHDPLAGPPHIPNAVLGQHSKSKTCLSRVHSLGNCPRLQKDNINHTDK